MTTQDTQEREIHPSHRTGLLLAIRDALALNGNVDADKTVAMALLNALVAPGATYAELANIKERAVVRAFDRVLREQGAAFPESRIDSVLDLLPLITPDLRHCGGCGGLSLSVKSAVWSRVSTPMCAKCGGVYGLVTFTAPTKAWTTHKLYDPGIAVDEEHFPIVDKTILSFLEVTGGVDEHIEEAMREVDPTGIMTLADVCDYLTHHPQGPKFRPIQTLKSMGNYTEFAVTPSALKVHLGRVLASKGVVMAHSDKTGQAVVVSTGTPTPDATIGAAAMPEAGTKPVNPLEWLRLATSTLPTCYPSGKEARVVLQSIGADTGSIDFSGNARTMWHGIVSHLKARGQELDLVRAAYEEFPRQMAPLLEGHINIWELRDKFSALPREEQIHLMMEAAPNAYLPGPHASVFDMFQRIERDGSVVTLHHALNTPPKA